MRRVALLLCLLCLLVAGCGFGEGATRGDVTLTVTRDFGTERLRRGRYVLDVYGVDNAFNKGAIVRGTSRVVFRVR